MNEQSPKIEVQNSFVTIRNNNHNNNKENVQNNNNLSKQNHYFGVFAKLFTSAVNLLYGNL